MAEKEKNVLERALKQGDQPALLSALKRLEQMNLTVEEMTSTRIGGIVNAVRKANKSNKQISSRAKALIKRWGQVVASVSQGTQHIQTTKRRASLERPAPEETLATKRVREWTAKTVESATIDPHEAEGDPTQPLVLAGKDCPPHPTTEITAYSEDRRCDGVDGRLGVDGRWYTWTEHMPMPQPDPAIVTEMMRDFIIPAANPYVVL